MVPITHQYTLKESTEAADAARESRQGDLTRVADTIQAGGTRVTRELADQIAVPIDAARQMHGRLSPDLTGKDRRTIAKAVADEVQRVISES